MWSMYSTPYAVHTSIKIDRPQNNASTKSQSYIIQVHFSVEKSLLWQIYKDRKGPRRVRQGQKNYCNLFGNCPVFSFLPIYTQTHMYTTFASCNCASSHFSFVDIATIATAALVVLTTAIASSAASANFFPSTIGLNCYCSSSRLS